MYDFIAKLDAKQPIIPKNPILKRQPNIYIEGASGMGLANNLWGLALAVYYKEVYNLNIVLRNTDSILYGTSNKFGRKTYKTENGNILSYKDSFFKKMTFCNEIYEDVDVLVNNFTKNRPVPRKSILIRGYCANINLFHEIHSKMPEYLHLNDSNTINYVRNKYKNLNNGIMIGIRRGPDGGFKKFNKDAYKNALDKLVSMKVDISNLFILTDVPGAWESIIGLQSEYPATEIDEDDYTQFIAGMMCKHYIISESSYHWWVAYMGIVNNSDKKVLYFNNSDLTTRELTMNNWIGVDWEST